MPGVSRIFARLLTVLLVAFFAIILAVAPAQAATCAPAASAGAAPSSWQTYCWLDMTSYNHSTATSLAGQNFSINLSDGSVLTFNLKTTGGGVNAIAAPSWGGAAVGNSSFLGIPGKPVMYSTTGGSLVTLTFSNISVTPPPGVATITNYAFVAASGESTHGTEYLEYVTNGSAWQVLDSVPPISGSRLPTKTGENTTTFRESGGGLTDSVGAYIVGSNTPTTVVARMQSGGLQGMMFAVRFASIRLSKTIGGARVSASDQFNFRITSTSSGNVFANGTTTGTGLGPFPAVVLATASGIPVTLSETMASGSSSALAQYQSVLTCTNSNSGSSTPMPSNVITTSYNFGSLQFGDTVSCQFLNTPFPHVTYRKILGAGGRIFDTDQFRLRIRDMTTGSNVNQTDTTGTGSSFTVDSTGPVQVAAGNQIRLNELASGTTNLDRYAKSTVCTNANTGSSTALPSGSNTINFTPAMGDVISCIITNTREAANAVITLDKSSAIISDPTGSANPKAIPGAIVEYTIVVTNQGDSAVDANSLKMRDIVPVEMEYQTSFALSFINGSTPSGLGAFNPSTMVGYSNQTAGAAPYTYAPASPYDGTVTGIAIDPSGSMSASDGINHPSFTIRYRMRIR